MLKSDWESLAIGWAAGAFVAIALESLFGLPPIVVVVGMFLLPLLLNWLSDMLGVFTARH